jgi:D-glycero-D-manno-heptose 1,7-bisphosphate phosphatase
MRAVFLDRDGVINRNLDHYVTRSEEFRFLPGALASLVALAASPLAVVIVTNQSAVGRGYMAVGILDDIHRRMLQRVRVAGGRIDSIYACVHRPEDGCSCRKPQAGLLCRAAIELGLDLQASYLVGDAASDVQAALAAGCRPILVLTGRGPAARVELARQHLQGYWVAEDLPHAVGLILTREEAGTVGEAPGASGGRREFAGHAAMAGVTPPASRIPVTGPETAPMPDTRRARGSDAPSRIRRRNGASADATDGPAGAAQRLRDRSRGFSSGWRMPDLSGPDEVPGAGSAILRDQ